MQAEAEEAVEAVAWAESQRVLTYLRANRKFGDLSRGSRELPASSPVRRLCEWRCNQQPEVGYRGLLDILLDIVKSPDYAGALTFVALEAVHGLVMAMFDHLTAHENLGQVLEKVCVATCECAFEETNAQVDEATTVQIISVLKLCTTRSTVIAKLAPESEAAAAAEAVTLLPTPTRMQAFERVLALWGHYRNSPSLRLSAHGALLGMLDFACDNMESQRGFMSSVLERMLDDIAKEPAQDRSMLFLRLLQRVTTHPKTSSLTFCGSSGGSSSSMAAPGRVRVLEDAVPLILMTVVEHYSMRVSVLTLLLPIVNRICGLCLLNHSMAEETGATAVAAVGLGALQVEALVSSVYIRLLASLADSLHQDANPSGGPQITSEEAAELLATLLEGLCDLLRPPLCRMLWCSFDALWHRPPLLERLVMCITSLFRDTPNTEQPLLPAYVSHLGATVLSKVVVAFAEEPLLRPQTVAATTKDSADPTSIKEQFRLRELCKLLMKQISDSPKKARKVFEASELFAVIQVPPGSLRDLCAEWAAKLALLFRTVNYAVPYGAVGEFFGQPSEDAEHAFMAFSETFDWGSSDIDGALRVILQSFLLPKEAQQIDRLLKTFAHTYYRKHVESSGGQPGYLKHEDAAYTLAFAVIMLNTDQHNPRLKRRMELTDFIRNNRGINEGENVPEDVQKRIFESIKKDEIKTPNSGDLIEGVSKARWQDYAHLIKLGYRDNTLLPQQLQSQGLIAHMWGLVERVGSPLRLALETALANDAGATSDALQGLQQLMRVADLAGRSADADSVLDCLFLFGSEVFHEQQPRATRSSRTALCLNALFQTVLAKGASPSARQLHALAYLSVQFALYGLFEGTVLPAPDSTTAELLRMPALAVDPPTGVVYSFLRKISTAPFGMLSLREEVDAASPGLPPMPLREKSMPATMHPGSGLDAEDDADSPVAAVPRSESAAAIIDGGAPSPPSSSAGGTSSTNAKTVTFQNGPEISPRATDPLRRQVEAAFEGCQLTRLLRPVIGQEEADMAQASSFDLLTFLSALFLAQRAGGASKAAKEEDLPFIDGADGGSPRSASSAVPQALILPKRALSLNILDGFEAMKFAVRFSLASLQCGLRCKGREEVPTSRWNQGALLEFAICSHVGLFHLLRRPDITERSLRAGLVGTFRVGSVLLTLRAADTKDLAISLGWPVRLLKLAIKRSETEPQVLVPFASLCLEAVRSFVVEVSLQRTLNSIELWRALFQLLLRAMPTCNRALWPGTRDKEVQAIQQDLWSRGIVWLLGHPHLLETLSEEEVPAADTSSAPTSAPSTSFLAEAMEELSTLAAEMASGNRQDAAKLIVTGYRTLLAEILAGQDGKTYVQGGDLSTAPDDAEPKGGLPKDEHGMRILATRAAAWGRVASSLLGRLGPMLLRTPATNDAEPPLIPLLLQTLLDGRIPSMLEAVPLGPHWARQTLEQLVTVWTKAVTAGAPLPVVRASVPLVAKFFLQNLHTLQRHECFSQLWLMVLRLELLFIERGINERCSELQEIATETLKNLLRVLLSSKLLAFVPPKSSNGSGSTQQPDPQEDAASGSSGTPVWWQMTWDCIEVFLPGFGEEFSRGACPKSEEEPQRQSTPAAEPPAVQEPAGASDA